MWDEARERVLWVDINAGTVHGGQLDGGFIPRTGACASARRSGRSCATPTGKLLVAGARRLYRVDRRPRVAVHADLVPAANGQPAQRRRLRPGRALPRRQHGAGRPPAARSAWYRLEADGSVTVLDDDLTHVQRAGLVARRRRASTASTRSPAIVWSRPTTRRGGEWGERRGVLPGSPTAGPTACASTPTATCGSRSGARGEVRCYTPAGERLATVSVPAPHTTSVAFVGPDLDLLLDHHRHRPSSARPNSSAYPLSGRLFTARRGRRRPAGHPGRGWAPDEGIRRHRAAARLRSRTCAARSPAPARSSST